MSASLNIGTWYPGKCFSYKKQQHIGPDIPISTDVVAQQVVGRHLGEPAASRCPTVTWLFRVMREAVWVPSRIWRSWRDEQMHLASPHRTSVRFIPSNLLIRIPVKTSQRIFGAPRSLRQVLSTFAFRSLMCLFGHWNCMQREGRPNAGDDIRMWKQRILDLIITRSNSKGEVTVPLSSAQHSILYRSANIWLN